MRRKFDISILLTTLILGPSLGLQQNIIRLGDFEWRVRNLSGDRNISVQGNVPGGIYSDLEEAGIIQDLYYRFNDVEYRWVGETDWEYSAEFTLEPSFLAHQAVQLDFQGLDTVASIWINSHHVGDTSNMFRRYIFPVLQFVNPGLNRLEVRFESAVKYARAQYLLQSQEHPVPPACVPDVFQGFCHANHIRKMQSSFSWDWGPAAPSSGIWQEATLLAFNYIRFKYVSWNVAESTGSQFTLNMEAIFEPGLEDEANVEIKVSIPGVLSYLEEVLLHRDSRDQMVWTASMTIQKSAVELWWPNGHGEQRLYDVYVMVGLKDGEDTVLLDEVLYPKALGFRTVELVQDHMEIAGSSFYFKINGEPIFMKGSNWIPADVLPERVSREDIFDLLYSAREAHMNMLRVWGGGVYEQEEFYDIADQLGILIWQDFMFACSMYPADEGTLLNVRHEVEHQVRRLARHPSLALWAGNNENEVALRGNWYGTDTNFSVYKEDYKRLYVETIQATVQELDSSRPFLLSSPSNGNKEAEGYIAMNPYSTLEGDVHVYNYRDNNWDPSIYGVPRFCSEYGFQSFPSAEIMATVSEDADWSFDSKWFRDRQHHPGGNLELPWQINLNLYLDLESLNTESGVKEFLYLSQVYQAVSLKTETEHYRRHRSGVNEKGEGMTMGALYWQLNDIWPGASWTSLEYGGKWKMSHYYAEQFFAGTLVSPVLVEEQVRVYVVCDHTLDSSLTLNIRAYHWRFEEVYSETLALGPVCAQQGSSLQLTTPLRELLEKGDCRAGSYDAYRLSYCLFYYELLNTSSGDLLSQNYLMASPRSLVAPELDFDSGLQAANLSVRVNGRVNELPEGPYLEVYDVEISSDTVALWVWVEALGVKGRFSHNGLHMVQPTRSILFLAKEYTSKEELESSLQIRAYKPY